MKKQEKAAEIRRLANEYAKSGNHSNWLSIESQIRFDGFPEARRVLDDKIIRNNLNSICKIATSPEEEKRRKLFDTWLKSTIESIVIPNIMKNLSNIKLYVLERSIIFINQNYSFEIRRMFGSNELEVEVKKFQAIDGKIYRGLNPKRIPNSDFEHLNINRSTEIILKLIHNSDQRTKRR